ncbi:hypothetical protein N3114_12600 (plasmid) [Aliarcobacter butzleri]|uniref:hypothetical protein n=1 Tax=Aliarcobacter butzleri TaxID=28197 RepID=UPI0021B2318B|nr:hypothetical protein [Aliarcobacter butzleri]UXC30729.1 hypothetical protein N3114_12600 [Aliarcobacter butzleri]
MIAELKHLIDNKILSQNESYFDIAFHRGFIIEQISKEEYIIKVSYSSDSEKILTYYENKKDFELKELLDLPIQDGAKTTIKGYIQDNITPYDFLVKCNIFTYPKWKILASSNKRENLEYIFSLLKEFRELIDKGFIDTLVSDFDFIIGKKRRNKVIETRPKCFDGLCVENNISKIFPFAREVVF